MASTADHGPPTPVLGKRTCSPHHGQLRVQQQRGGGKQHGDGVCSAVLAAAARWHIGRAAEAAQQQRGDGRQRRAAGGGSTVEALAEQWRRPQRGGSVGRSRTAAARQKQESCLPEGMVP
jgi:hypothetical protein